MQVKGKLFTYVALYLAVFFFAFQWFFDFIKVQEGYELPLLLSLLMNELAMFICLFGVWAGVDRMMKSGIQTKLLFATIACVMAAVMFLYKGAQYWPEGVDIF